MMFNDIELKGASYVHEKSDIIPDWVSKLDAFKSKIKTHLHSEDNGKTIDIKFCHPISVPNPKK